MIVTELGVMEPSPEGLVLTEVTEGVEVEAVVAATDAPLIISPDLRLMAS
ncbi:hypothetical protein [Jannaschia rubra]